LAQVSLLAGGLIFDRPAVACCLVASGGAFLSPAVRRRRPFLGQDELQPGDDGAGAEHDG